MLMTGVGVNPRQSVCGDWLPKAVSHSHAVSLSVSKDAENSVLSERKTGCSCL